MTGARARVLVIASAFPTVLVLGTVVVVLGGGLDADTVAAYPGLTAAPGFGDHLRSIAWSSLSVPLLCTALGSGALAAASCSVRFSPRSAEGRCAGLVAAAAALAGVVLAGLVVWAWYAPPTPFQREQSAQPTDGTVVLVSVLQGGPGPDVAAVLVPAVLAALAAAVLLRPVSRRRRTVGDQTVGD